MTGAEHRFVHDGPSRMPREEHPRSLFPLSAWARWLFRLTLRTVEDARTLWAASSGEARSRPTPDR